MTARGPIGEVRKWTRFDSRCVVLPEKAHLGLDSKVAVGLSVLRLPAE